MTAWPGPDTPMHSRGLLCSLKGITLLSFCFYKGLRCIPFVFTRDCAGIGVRRSGEHFVGPGHDSCAYNPQRQSRAGGATITPPSPPAARHGAGSWQVQRRSAGDEYPPRGVAPSAILAGEGGGADAPLACTVQPWRRSAPPRS